jgi:sulfur-oxidizing protein SoxX
MRRILIFPLLVLMLSAQAGLADVAGPTEDSIARGKAIAFERGKGNCLACHVIVGGELAGNYGPPLLLMKVRYPDRADLRSKIWDASVREPTTRMPPYGRHRILTENEIDLLVDFIHTL